MRKGLTLIELILSMVIIAIVFSIVPKIIFASNKSMELSMKEDALFNAYSLMGSVLKLNWDENTSKNGNILDTSVNTCDDYRIGGFKGSRNCIDDDNASSKIGQDTGNDDYNDVDDYDGNTTEVNNWKGNLYDINITVNYVDNNYNSHSKTTTQELKEINTTVFPGSDNKKMANFKASFFYHSANLGHIQIKKEQWK